ncbi:MAG TPA: malto-oligosyltrehalose synthase [Longimicrobiales bacterium]|nr:malto-oligosyltrehalose synthase [Longimicrobiales bacterium]
MRIPTATYRLQLHADFTLHDARALLDYLQALGITDLYLSPVFEARPGSRHGYDVTDPRSIAAALGGRAAFDALAGDAHARGMGVLLDIVPNHMAASELSPWWADVLRRGPDSPYAGFFDIDWGTGRVLLPVLGSELDEAIARDELRLVRGESGEWVLDYHGRALPLREDAETRSALASGSAADAAQRHRLTAAVADRQHYQLVPWQTASTRLGYRRFFDITDLAGVRVERPEVFAASHALVRELVAGGQVTGLRVDHVDGLRDPAAYLERLREHTGAFTLVEKILASEEPLPRWPVEGTTGYEFLNLVNGLFLDPAGHAAIVAAYRRFTGEHREFGDIVHEKKHLVMDMLFGGELTRLAAELHAVLEGRYSPDSVRRTLAEVTACMPVYRTYLAGYTLAPQDRAALAHALDELRRRAPDLDDALVEEIAHVLQVAGTLAERRAAALEFVRHWQQFSGPVMAKGFEDTALYVWAPLLSANEVGSTPAAPALSVAAFHGAMRERVREWPHAMSATATHDTKRGEDVRTRLDVLSELPHEWLIKLRAWVRRSVDQKETAAQATGLADDAPVPNGGEENVLYQTLVGAWPLEDDAGDFVERVQEYMTKALREAKQSTSWHGPDEDYEAALAAFVDRLLAGPQRPVLRAEIESFTTRLAWYGALNSLSQTVVKVTAPGVPDFYQGTELWSFVLVDPDNRRPVDYAARAECLQRLEPLLGSPDPAGAGALLRTWRDGTVKLFATAAALRFRRERAGLFRWGAYLPIDVAGARAGHVVAFARRHEDQWALTVAPRLYTALCAPGALPAGEWADTRLVLPGELAGRTITDAFTGRTARAANELPLRALLADFPVALLG